MFCFFRRRLQQHPGRSIHRTSTLLLLALLLALHLLINVPSVDAQEADKKKPKIPEEAKFWYRVFFEAKLWV